MCIDIKKYLTVPKKYKLPKKGDKNVSNYQLIIKTTKSTNYTF